MNQRNQAEEDDHIDWKLSGLASRAESMIDKTYGQDKARWNEAYNRISSARSAVRVLMTDKMREETPY